jgi:hypothetical protein
VGAKKQVRSSADLQAELVSEIARFVRNEGRAPKIEGPAELQRALDLLSHRIRHNSRGWTGRGKNRTKRSVTSVGATLKEWYPEEVIHSEAKRTELGEQLPLFKAVS